MTENEKIFKLQDVVVALVSMSEDIVSKEEFEKIDTAGVDIVNCLDELKRWRTSKINENIKNPFANMYTSICHNCNHKDEYIEELESEIEEYQAIGTIEEFKVLKEKNTPKKVAYQGEHEKCPTCGSFRVFGNYCTECGQKIDFGKEE